MSTIKLTVSNRFLQRLKDMVGLKKLAGNFYGEEDELCYLLIMAFEKKEKEISIILKEEE